MKQMQVEKIGNRGLLFSFKEPFLTNVYVIIGHERVFVLDTFLGSDSMEIVKQRLEDEGHSHQHMVVFNSHGDYDHYWGNASIDNALIIGHEQCQARILKEGEEALHVHGEHKRGEVLIKPPSLVFSDRLSFPDEGLTFFYTPGHTIDSASCYDMEDKVLFAGDNVEPPFPYVYNTDVNQFYETLMSYRDIEWNVMIASHAPPLFDSTLLESNIKYLESLKNWKMDLSKLDKEEFHMHYHNVIYLEGAFSKEEITPDMKKHIDDVKKTMQHQ
ncbi:MAG: MBL fold metallo-hydrolase [Promethearchaeota archaeon]